MSMLFGKRGDENIAGILLIAMHPYNKTERRADEKPGTEEIFFG